MGSELLPEKHPMCAVYIYISAYTGGKGQKPPPQKGTCGATASTVKHI